MTLKLMIFVIFAKIFVSNAGKQQILDKREFLDPQLVDNVRYSLDLKRDESVTLTNRKERSGKDIKFKICPKQKFGTVNANFHLYTKNNLNNPQRFCENILLLSKSNFDPKRPTKLIIHGWVSGPKSPVNTILRKAILDNCDCNVFVVDWSYAASLFYIDARQLVLLMASKVAKFLDLLNLFGGMRFEDLTLIGHSLGAHVAGLAGKKTKRGKIGVIIGLDPAAPMFNYKNFTERLSTNDANYVQTIHTTELLGFRDPVGNASFYPNWGRSQPGCNGVSASICSHGRAYVYYGESLYPNSSFVAYPCLSYDEIKKNICTSLNSNTRMGGEPGKEHYPQGIFYVPTNDVAPYSYVEK